MLGTVIGQGTYFVHAQNFIDYVYHPKGMSQIPSNLCPICTNVLGWDIWKARGQKVFQGTMPVPRDSCLKRAVSNR